MYSLLRFNYLRDELETQRQVDIQIINSVVILVLLFYFIWIKIICAEYGTCFYIEHELYEYKAKFCFFYL